MKIILLILLVPILFLACKSGGKKDKVYQFEERTLALDTNFFPKVTIDSICCCKTTFADIISRTSIQPVALENMQFGKNCREIDSKFGDDKGYSLSAIKGVMLQKDDGTEYVSKIHLNKDFEGRLPNGEFISLRNLKLKDVVKMYPEFQYGTRDCSQYWDYNDDTIHFYFKVDTSIKRYPLNEQYYAEKPIEGIDIVLWCYERYAPDYTGEIVYERPLYAPWSVTHVNAYVLKPKSGINARIKELFTFGKKAQFNIVRLGKWLEYSPDHQILVEEYYDDKGNLIKKVR